jgi:hypothetical protein
VALKHGYGVLVGVLEGFERDRPDNQGRWFHDNLTISAGTSSYRAAVDVDSHQSATGVQWKLIDVDLVDLGPLPVQQAGYHPLVSMQGNGALDHTRAGFALMWRMTWPTIWLRQLALRVPVVIRQPWITGSNVEAATALESMLAVGKAVLVWGEPFTVGLGMHNVHQNQGDPAGSQWWDDDGIWQDGGVAAPATNGRYRLFISKFSSQAGRTDEQGHPM